MPKLLFLLLSSSLLSTLSVQAESYNAMIIDSSFAPVIRNGQKIGIENCYWIDEQNRQIPEKSDCYDKEAWNEIKKEEPLLVKGYLDRLAGKKDTHAAQYWNLNMMSGRERLLDLRSKLNLVSHGSRSAMLFLDSSEKHGRPLFVRNVSAQSGQLKLDSANWKKRKTDLQPYQNGCGLNNWKKDDLLKFAKLGRLLPYQEKISSLLKQNDGIKVVSMSWGYKHSWIAQDHPRCSPEQVNKEYFVLRQSWQNLLSRHKNVVFVTAIGNESQDYAQKAFRNNDLWGSLARNGNLVLVGALNKKGYRASFSNYGLNGMLWAVGQGVDIHYPTPWDSQGYLTKVNGTSSSAPIISGKLVAELEKKKTPVNIILSHWQSSHLPKKWTYEDYAVQCDKKDAQCLQALSGLIKDQPLWAGLKEKYQKINRDWFPAKVEVRFTDDKLHAGRQVLEKRGNVVVPVVQLSKSSDPYEMLLTLQHELHHIVSIENHIGEMHKTVKVEGCMTKYQLLRLKDEKHAFEQELAFWQKAPEWFRQRLNKKKIQSHLFSAEMNFSKYYNRLEKNMKENENFIVGRYIDLDQAPKCAAKVAEWSRREQ